jgi:hypothetical protein
MSDWRPIKITCKTTGCSVYITILEREMYLSGMFSFDDLYEMNSLSEFKVPEAGASDAIDPDTEDIIKQ